VIAAGAFVDAAGNGNPFASWVVPVLAPSLEVKVTWMNGFPGFMGVGTNMASLALLLGIIFVVLFGIGIGCWLKRRLSDNRLSLEEVT
jgi:hypothetical protein